MKSSKSSTTNTSTGPMTTQVAKTVRTITASWKEKSPDDLRESTSFVDDLKCDSMVINLIVKEIEQELAFNMGIDKKQAILADIGAGGRSIWQQLVDKVNEHLPQVELPKGAAARKGLTIGILEQLIGKLLQDKSGPGDQAAQPPPATDSAVVQAWTWDQQNWMWQLPQELGPRNFQRLLVAGLRYAEEPRRHFEQEAEEFAEVLDIMQLYAETGKSKTAINNAKKIVNQWKWWKDKSAEAIHAFLHEPKSEVVLPKLMTAIADRRQLQPLQVFEVLQSLHKQIAESSSDTGETDSSNKKTDKAKMAPKAAKASKPAVAKSATAAKPAAKKATGTSAAGTRYFEFQDDKSDKFWEISTKELDVTVRFGRTGTSGQTQVKSFDSAAEATGHVSKLVAEKVKKGYVEH